MKIIEQPAMALAFIHREAGKRKDGTQYNAFNIFNYIVEGDETSRSFFISDDENPIIKDLREIAKKWGTPFVFDGNIDGRGNVEITNVNKVD